MKNSTMFMSCLGFLALGSVFFLIQGGYVFVRLPYFFYPALTSKQLIFADRSTDVSKEVSYFLWKKDTQIATKKTILSSKSPREFIHRLVNGWLKLASDEGVISSDVRLSYVGLTNQATVALFSFNQTFLQENLSLHSRWKLVESLLMTLRSAGVVLEGVYFLVGKKAMPDDYLDFSQRWPIAGYNL